MCFKHVTLSILQTLVIATLLIFSLFLLFTALVVKGHLDHVSLYISMDENAFGGI